jgi:hypothetical protein
MKMKINTRKGMKVLGVASVAIGLAVLHANAALYPAPEYTGPTPEPTGYPSGFETFTPPVSGDSPNALAPEITEWTRNNDPGNTMALTAETLGASGLQFMFNSGGSISYAGSLTSRYGDRVAAVKLPEALPRNTMYLMWPGNANGYGAPVAINQTEAWWLGFDKVSSGDTFAVYGRNLTKGNGESHLYIQGHGWIVSTSANPFRAEFTVPSGLANGTYSVYAHNGAGRRYGFSEVLTLTVESAYSWNSNVYDVTSYGANGNDSSPDDAGISAAISAANNDPGSSVRFPAGTFYLEKNIHFRGDKKIVGAGMGATIIKPLPGYSGAEAFIKTSSNIVLSNLTLQTTADLNYEDFVWIGNKSNIVIANVEFTGEHNTGEARTLLDCTRASYVEITGCKFVVARDVFVSDMSHVKFKDCSFLGIRDCNQLMAFKGAKYVDMSNCTSGNFNEQDITDGFGWCKGRWVTGTGPSSFCYFGENTSVNMMPRLDPDKERWAPGQPDQNSGEQIMFEGLTARFRGTPTEVPSNKTLRFDGMVVASSPRVATITAGKGLGQSRIIESIDAASGTVTLSKPWKIVPDTSSVISIGNYLNHVAAYKNQLDGRPRAATEPLTGETTASTGFQAYGGAFNLVVSDNVFSELNTGLHNFSVGDDNVHPDYDTAPPNYFNMFKNNTSDYCYDAFVEHFYCANKTRGKPLVGTEPALLGNVYRNNVATNSVRYDYPIVSDYSPGYIVLPVRDGNHRSDGSSTLSYSPDDGSLEAAQVWVEPTSSILPPPPEPPPSPILTGIMISGPSQVNEETTAQYACTASYSDGTSKVVTPSWSENSAYASISGSGVLAAGNVSVDKNVTITASYGGESDTHGVTIKYVAPVLSSIVISGPSSVNEETAAQYVCTANYSDGTSVVVSPGWSENSAFSTISGSGLLTAGNVSSDQSVTLSASYGGKTDTHTVTIKYVAPVLTSIAISGPTSLNEETSAQYACTASYSDGTSKVVTPSWSENSAYASISGSGVLAAGNVSVDKNVTITASYGGKSDTHGVTIKYVAPVFSGIVISGPSSVNEETVAQYVCTANYSDGTSVVVSPGWSENSASATISGSGLLTAGDVSSDQGVTLTASYGGRTDTHAVTIKYVAPVVTSIAISGPASLDEETTAQYTCTANYSDGTSKVVTPSWNENSSAASISGSGVLTAGDVTADQSVTLTASFGGKSDTHGVTIKYLVPTLTSIAISGPASVDEETSAQYVCTANYSDGTSEVVTPVWSENSTYTAINDSGLLTAGNVSGDENVTITATHDGQSDTYAVVVSYVVPPVVLTGITISGPGSMDENTTAQFVCTAHYSDGTSSEVAPVWSDDSTYASIGGSGVLSARNVAVDENVMVTARFDGEVEAQVVVISAIGDQVVFPLSGFDGKTVSADLWDHTAQVWVPLGEDFEPEELVIENVNPDQWYRLALSEYDDTAGQWIQVHSSWVHM